MKSVLLKLRETQSSMSSTERAVSDYLLTHQGEAMSLSIHQLAEKTFASPSTIIRMCQRIGFAGYKEFRQAVTCEVAVRRFSHAEQPLQEISPSDTTQSIVEKVTQKNILSLEDSKNLLDAETLDTCVELLKSARTVLLFGLGASLYAARDAYLKFLRLNKPCVINDDWSSQLLQAKNSSPQDLAIVVSFSGETAEVIQSMRALRENGTPIIAITRCVPSPVAELADYRLYTTDDAATLHDGTMSSRISQLNVFDVLYTAFVTAGLRYKVQRFVPSREAGTA